MDRSPLLIELGRYSPQGRVGGTWVFLNGCIRYNNGIRIIMDRDLGEGRSGGLRRTCNAVEEDGGALVLPELSYGQERTIIETAISINVDPTVVFTHVDEDDVAVGTIALQPNPATDELFVHADLRGAPSARLELVDVQGRIVYAQTADVSSMLNGVRLDLRDVPVGLLSVRMITKNGVVVRAFVHRP
jgi:hypothetical protein